MAGPWYYGRGDQQIGPVSPAELRRAAAAGEFGPDDLVWRDGMTHWIAARNVKGLFDDAAQVSKLTTAEPAPAPVDLPPASAALTPASAVSAASLTPPTEILPAAIPPAVITPPTPALPAAIRPAAPERPLRHVFDVVLDVVRAQFTVHFVDQTATVFATCGHYGMYVVMAACLLFGMIRVLMQGFRGESFSFIPNQVTAVVLLAVLQYAAFRFLAALARLNRNTTGKIASTAFPDCCALLGLGAGLFLLVGSTVTAIRTGVYGSIVFGLGAFIVCEYLALAALQPAALGIVVEAENQAGEEALGVLSFLLKLAVQLTPVVFAAGVGWGALQLAYACLLALANTGPAAAPDDLAAHAVRVVCYCAALPLAIYVLFLLYYLSIDLIRATLSLPGKLDQLHDQQRPPPDDGPASRRFR